MWERGLKYARLFDLQTHRQVAPHVGAWIEMTIQITLYIIKEVAPHVGAWIEIWRNSPGADNGRVAPHVGAWIEIWEKKYRYRWISVAPHVGAWIEIQRQYSKKILMDTSLPMWERGLKSVSIRALKRSLQRRSPCGSVD